MSTSRHYMHPLLPDWTPVQSEITLFPLCPSGPVQRISPQDGKPRHVVVDQDAFDLLAAHVRNITVPMWLDFDHEAKASAGRLLGIRWDDTLGIVGAVEWSYAGELAVRGGSHRFISPTFLHDPETLRPYAFDKRGICGALVNSPAFQQMPALQLPVRFP